MRQRVILVAILLGSSLLWFPKAVLAVSEGECYCKLSTEGAERKMSQITTADGCKPEKIGYVRVKTKENVDFTACVDDNKDDEQANVYKECFINRNEKNDRECWCKDVKAKCNFKPAEKLKVDYCCCKTSAGQGNADCVLASNYEQYKICNQEVFDAGGVQVEFWKKGRCTCTKELKDYKRIKLPKTVFIEWNCRKGVEGWQNLFTNCRIADDDNEMCACDSQIQRYVVKNVPNRLAHINEEGKLQLDTCTNRAYDLDIPTRGRNCVYSEGGDQCLCIVGESGPETETSENTIAYEDECKRMQGCVWKATYEANTAGYLIKPVDENNRCIAAGKEGFSDFQTTIKALQIKAKTLNQLSSFNTPAQFVGQIVKVLLAFIGSIALILYIYAGIMWMRSSGNSEEIGKAQQILVWTTLGVAVMLGSYLLVNFIFGNILRLL